VLGRAGAAGDTCAVLHLPLKSTFVISIVCMHALGLWVGVFLLNVARELGEVAAAM
jgi:hypothetical protein